MTDGMEYDAEHDLIHRRITQLMYAEKRLISVWEDSSTPKWLKWYYEGKLFMGRVNKAYTRATGISLPAYRGEPDSKLWGNEAGEMLNDNDQEVINSRLPLQAFEPLTNPRTKIDEVWMVIKEPYLEGDRVLGTWGKGWPIPAQTFWDNEDLFRSLPLIQ